MIFAPNSTIADATQILEFMVEDLASKIPRGERKKFKLIYLNCAPFIIEVEGTAEARQ